MSGMPGIYPNPAILNALLQAQSSLHQANYANALMNQQQAANQLAQMQQVAAQDQMALNAALDTFCAPAGPWLQKKAADDSYYRERAEECVSRADALIERIDWWLAMRPIFRALSDWMVSRLVIQLDEQSAKAERWVVAGLDDLKELGTRRTVAR